MAILQSLAIAIIRRLLIAGCIAIHTGKWAAEMTFRGAKRIHKDPEEEKMMVPKLMTADRRRGRRLIWALCVMLLAAFTLASVLNAIDFLKPKPKLGLWRSFRTTCHLSGSVPRFRLLPTTIKTIPISRLREIIRAQPTGFTFKLLGTNLRLSPGTVPSDIEVSAYGGKQAHPAGEWHLAWGGKTGIKKLTFRIKAGHIDARYHVAESLMGQMNFSFMGPGIDLGAHLPVKGTTRLSLQIKKNPPSFQPFPTGFDADGGTNPGWSASSTFGLTPDSHPAGSALVLWHYQFNRLKITRLFTAVLRRSGWTRRRTAETLRRVELWADRMSLEEFMKLQLSGRIPIKMWPAAANRRLLRLFALSAFYGYYNFPPKCLKALRIAIGANMLYVLALDSATFVKKKGRPWMNYYLFDSHGYLSCCGSIHPVAAGIHSGQLAGLAVGISGLYRTITGHKPM